MTTRIKARVLRWAISFVAVVFGLMTIKEGGLVLIGNEAARAAAGNYIPFVLWFNFLAGFAYVLAGVGLFMLKRWAVWLSIGIAVTTAVTFIFFGMHILTGGAFELHTVIAMSMRTFLWIVIALLAW